jgi:hypothetical protein
MLRPSLVVIILAAPPAGAAAYARGNGGYVTPELDRPSPGRLLNQDYLKSTRRARPTSGAFSIGRSDGPGPLDKAAGQPYRRQHLQRLLTRRRGSFRLR